MKFSPTDPFAAELTPNWMEKVWPAVSAPPVKGRVIVTAESAVLPLSPLAEANMPNDGFPSPEPPTYEPSKPPPAPGKSPSAHVPKPLPPFSPLYVPPEYVAFDALSAALLDANAPIVIRPNDTIPSANFFII